MRKGCQEVGDYNQNDEDSGSSLLAHRAPVPRTRGLDVGSAAPEELPWWLAAAVGLVLSATLLWIVGSSLVETFVLPVLFAASRGACLHRRQSLITQSRQLDDEPSAREGLVDR